MNLVSFALRRPISLLTIVIAVALVGFLAVDRMSRDIFPDLGVPVLYVAQPYGGMDPAQMEGFIVNYYEYHFLYITGIEHVESKSIQGVGLIKLQFHPGTDMAQATAETVGYVDRARAFLPTGTVPPFVMRFDGGSVPVGDLVFSSKTKTVAELQDAALFKVRPLFATLPGVSAPPPFGSSQRTILVRLDPGKLLSYIMSRDEVVRSGRGALQGAPIVCDLAGRLCAAALRLEPAHHSRSLGSRQAAFLHHVAGRGGAVRPRRSSGCAHCLRPCRASLRRRPSARASAPFSFAWIPASCFPTSCRGTRWCGQAAALFRVRPLFATLPGVSAPPPFGSSQRTILVRLDPNKLRSYNMSPDEVVR